MIRLIVECGEYLPEVIMEVLRSIKKYNQSVTFKFNTVDFIISPNDTRESFNREYERIWQYGIVRYTRSLQYRIFRRKIKNITMTLLMKGGDEL